MTFFSWSLALWSVEDVEKWLHLRQNSVRLVERLLMGELSEQLCGSNNVHHKCAFPYQLYIMRPWRSPDTAYKTNSTVIYSHENVTAMNYVTRNSPEMFWNRLKWYLIQLEFFFVGHLFIISFIICMKKISILLENYYLFLISSLNITYVSKY